MSYTNITVKNKEVRDLQKSEFFKEFKGKLSLKVKKEHYNSSTITILVKKESVNEFFSDEIFEGLRSFNLPQEMYKRRIYPNNRINELYHKIREITQKDVTYYETADYGNQPSEYWWMKIETV